MNAGGAAAGGAGAAAGSGLGATLGSAMPYVNAGMAGLDMIQQPGQQAAATSQNAVAQNQSAAWSSPEYQKWANTFWGGGM